MKNKFFLLTGLVITIAYSVKRSESIGVPNMTLKIQNKKLDKNPHVASIRLRGLDIPFGNGHICSGTLFAVNKILTSADCLVQDIIRREYFHPSTLRVVLGTTNRFKLTDSTVVISHGITYGYHPDFNVDTSENDICVIFIFNGILNNHPDIEPLPLSKIVPDIGQDCLVTSWSFNRRTFVVSDELENVTMITQNRSICEQSDLENMICVNDGPEISGEYHECFSELGEGLVCDSSVVGVIAYDISCEGTDEVLGILFTPVAHHLKWIEKATPMNFNREIRDRPRLDINFFVLFEFIEYSCGKPKISTSVVEYIAVNVLKY